MSEEVGAAPQGQAQPVAEPVQAEPSIIELTDDSMVKLPGGKEPVKYGDYYRKYQSEFTKRSQRLSELEKREAQLSATLQERENALKRYEQLQRPEKPNPRQKLVESIQSLPYLKGQDAARVVEEIGNQLSSYDNALGQRDQLLYMMAQQINAMRQQVQSLNQTHVTSSFDSKIKGWLKELDLPEEAEDLAKEIYLAYEGDSLDEEYPQILKNRWEQVEKAILARREKKLRENRRPPFVPGKGAQGSPSSKLSLAGKTAAEKADALWSMVEGGPGT